MISPGKKTLPGPPSPIDGLAVHLETSGPAGISDAQALTSSIRAEWRDADLAALCQEMLGGRQLMVVSNRGPVEHHVADDGRLHARRGTGGVITALSSLARYLDFTWVASAMTEGDRRVAELAADVPWTSSSCDGLALRYVAPPPWAYHRYYNVFCNPMLWFIQHRLLGQTARRKAVAIFDAWDQGYVRVNQAFADVVASEARQDRGSPCVMVHDYHLYLVPHYLRRAIPNATITHFVHIPWPGPARWYVLPERIRNQICHGLAQADVLGFQCARDVHRFLETCEEFLPDASVDRREGTVDTDGHRAHVRSYPISIDVQQIRSVSASASASRHASHLRSLSRKATIVRVDRLDPTKNVLLGFAAYRRLLEQHPELRGQVTFLAFLVPSRMGVREYRLYAEQVRECIRQVNATFGDREWTPIHAFFEDNYIQAVAGLGMYDVLLVNSVVDGMNLVAKEGPVVNTRNGVLVLSRATGAYDQLRGGAVAVDPLDVEGTAGALYNALVMDQAERARRTSALVAAVEGEDLGHWLRSQFQDLISLGYPGASASHSTNSSTSATPAKV